MKRLARLAIATATLAVAWLAPSAAMAAPPWVERTLTLPEHDWAFDVGMGVGHYDYGPRASGTGPGVSFEGAVSVVRHLELGFRGGARAGDEARAAQADRYGRLFDRQTWGTRTSPLANPEVRIRGQLVDLEIFELALEGRVWLPFEGGSQLGTMFGVPMALHLGSIARLDFGAYVPVLYYDPVQTVISLPFDAWFQIGEHLWLGPMTGFEIDNPGSHGHFSAGFGLGYQFTSWFDLKTMFLFPRVDEARGTSNFGAGVGVQLRIE